MIVKEKIELRKAVKEEAKQAVPLIYSSGPDAFDYVFKNQTKSATGFLSHAFVKKGGEFSYQNHYSLYYENQMVGIGSVFNAKEAGGFTSSDAMNIFQFYRLQSFGTVRRGLQVEGIIKLPVKNEITIAHLGISAALRGKGFGTILIDLLKEKANKTADSRFILDVSEENPRAKLLYERLGFVVTKKNNSTLKNKLAYVPNHFRMELK